MTGWRSTKDGRHFRTKSKPGLNSNGNHSSNLGSQPSSMHQSNHKSPEPSKDIPVSCNECKCMFVDKLYGPEGHYHACPKCKQKINEENRIAGESIDRVAREMKAKEDAYWKEEKKQARKEQRELKKLGLTADQYDTITSQLQQKAVKDKEDAEIARILEESDKSSKKIIRADHSYFQSYSDTKSKTDEDYR